ncbi:uncharacterized protein [Nicotiana tomentosiformis]|uniref:uncharacterized protein n=1 Tax=Nicotiana tomentosiformis TaxID=4098 RepID=UPI00388C9D8E
MAVHEVGDGYSQTTAAGPLFRIPKEIECDNGPQFIGAKVTKFLEDLKIKRITSSPYHPSANGQAESTNKVIIQNLKKRLEAAKGKWPEELPGVLWAYRKMAKSSTGETLFSLVYGVEALIPVEVEEPTLRYFQANEGANNKEILVNLELLDERRELAYIRMATQKQRIERYYNQRTNLRYFKVGDLVLWKVTQNTRELNAGKLGKHGKAPTEFHLSPGKVHTSWRIKMEKGCQELERGTPQKFLSQLGFSSKVFNEATTESILRRKFQQQQ